MRACAKELKTCATKLDIDLSEELEKATNVKQMKEITEIENQMKDVWQTQTIGINEVK